MAYRSQLMASCGRWPDDVAVSRLAIPLGDTPAETHALAVLDASERQRATQYRHCADQRRFIHTRAALRTLLGERLRLPPAAVPLQASARGRLFVPGHDGLSFNVSHAGAHALIAVSATRTVGVDIERIDMALDWVALSELVCTSAEVSVLHRHPIVEQPRQFFRCWTAKEALLKALGMGITEGLKALSVDLDRNTAQQPTVDFATIPALAPAADLHFHWLNDFPGYVGCLAFRA